MARNPIIREPYPEMVVTPLICEAWKASTEVLDECHEY